MTGRGRPKISAETEEKILELFKKHPDWSLRELAEEVGGVSYGTVRTVLSDYGFGIGYKTKEDSK